MSLSVSHANYDFHFKSVLYLFYSMCFLNYYKLFNNVRFLVTDVGNFNLHFNEKSFYLKKDKLLGCDVCDVGCIKYHLRCDIFWSIVIFSLIVPSLILPKFLYIMVRYNLPFNRIFFFTRYETNMFV
jgi:hypothetical protein